MLQRRLRDDHRVPLIGLGVAGEEPGGPRARESRQVRRRRITAAGAGEREGLCLRDWSTTTASGSGRTASRIALLFTRPGALSSISPKPGRDACPMGQFPDIEPDDGLATTGWCHGVILQSVGRSEPLPATPTLPGRGACPRFLSVVRSGERPRWQHPGPSTGRGEREAIRRRPIGGPLGGFARIVSNAPNARNRNLSVAHFRL